MADTATDALPSWTSLRRQRLAGIALMCAALMCFSCLDATAKWVNRSVDPLVTVWARYMSAFLLTAVVLNPWTQPRLLGMDEHRASAHDGYRLNRSARRA